MPEIGSGNVLHEGNRDLGQRLRATGRPGMGAIVTPESAVLINSWVGTATFRRTTDGSLELGGKISGGVSGTVAFILPATHRPASNVSFLTDMTSGASFIVARVVVDSDDGTVTIYY